MKDLHKIALSMLVLALSLMFISLASVGAVPGDMKTGEEMLFAQGSQDKEKADIVQLPLVAAWYKGKSAYYIQTEASDQQVAKQQGVNFVPGLASAIGAGAVDDIYVVTNFNQANVIPSAPIPAGPDNNDTDYSPLWQVSTVTWNQDQTPHTLKSEKKVLAAEAAGLVTITKTNIVVNCPVIFTPQGGLLPTAKITLKSDGAVYTMTNDPTDNQIIRYERATDGSLSNSGNFSTLGMGTGGGLGNQGGLVLGKDGKMLLAVNANSNDISAFRVGSTGLMLTDKVSSGGTMPVSITIHEDLVYVLNAGGNGNITGYRLSDHGKLSMIPGSSRPLSGVATSPAQIAFNPDGGVLVVTEKATNLIDTYTVDDEGIANGPMPQASNGQTPFGFAFDKRGKLIISEAFGGAPGASALSSYSVDEDGNLKTINSSVPDFQTAACWVVITKNGKFAYTTNFGNDTISSYKVSKKGMISLYNQVAGTTDAGPIDMALSNDNKFLYSLNSGDHTITAFRINSNGNLTSIATVGGLPVGANGLAAQ